MADDAVGGRGFTLCRVVLEIDFEGVLTGTAHLQIHPTNPSLRTVYLHASPLLQINNVTLSSPTPSSPLLPTPASFAHCNPFQPLPVREPPMDIKSHQEIKRKTWAALGERDEGELAISVSHGWVRLVETAGADGTATVSLAPIDIQIDYQLVAGGDVIEGIVFRRPGDGGDDTQIPHMFLSPTTYDSARIWTPCVDNLWERCTWELEFIVPRYLEGGEPTGDNDAFPVMVVASGELMEQVTHPHDPHKVIFYYLQTIPATVQHISFAAGPFEMIQIANGPGGESQKPMLAFCLPGHVEETETSTAFLSRAMTFYSVEFGSFPYSAYKMVFVANPRSQSTVAVTMSIFSSDLLYPSNVIDQGIETRQVLSVSLIQQWVGVTIIQRTLSDTWLITGLALYLHGLFIKHLLGNNEYRFRLKKDIDRCAHMDQGDQLPLCQPGVIDPPSSSAMVFISLKAPLVLHILDRHIVKSGTSLGLTRVIPKIFLALISDDLPGNMISTGHFFRLCRKASGMDLLSFMDQWVYGSGCPHLSIRTTFIRKKFVVEFTVNQSQPALQVLDGLDPKSKEKALAHKRPTTFFEGSLTVRIHEADGAPFEHLVDIKHANKMFPLPFNTKYKRTRRSGHVAARFSKLQDVLTQAEDNDDDAAEELRDVERGEVFAYPPWDEEEERRQWRVGEWSEEEAGAMLGEGGGYEWIRVDPDCEWLAHFDIQERPWYWISQLQGDRDVVAQLQAIQRMTMYPSPVIASELARTVLVENYYFRVRMEAARALAAYNTAEADYMGLFLLVKLFHTLYCHPTSNEEDPVNTYAVPLPNDFSNFSNYFLKKSMVTALSEMRDPATRMVWRNVRKLLLNVLRFNDNSTNEYSDSHYMATVISAVGGAFAAGVNLPGAQPSDEDREIDRQLYKEASDANERAMTVDRLVPSYQNVVTQAGLQAQLKSILVGQRTNDPRTFLSYTREGNYEPLRMLAFDCLLLSKSPGRSMALAQYLFQVIRNDHSLTVRRHVARALSESILVTLAVGEVYMAVAPGVVEVNVDATNEQREKEKEQEQAKIVKALRKDFNSKPEMRQVVQQALMDAFVGHDNDILFALIKAAEVISNGTPEPKPGAMITLSTPVAETPTSAAPKIRLSLAAPSPVEPKSEPGDYGFPRAASPGAMSGSAAPIKLVLNTGAPPKEKKRKKVEKAQKKGMSDQDFKTITIVLAKLVGDKRSMYFRQPVDPIRDQAPDYFQIVSQPMDLSTVRAKFDSGMYASRKEFEDDIRLLVRNCYLYNPVGTPARKAGEIFEKYFNNVWLKTENTLKSSMAPPPSTSKASVPVATSSGSAAGGSGLMPPPPIPPGGAAAGPMRIKLKPSKSVTLDVPTDSAAMAPPPAPTTKKAKEKAEKAAKATEKAAEKAAAVAADPGSSPAKEKPAKKKREPKATDLLDDLLGAEVDAMDRASAPDPFDDLLGPPPPVKKVKLNPKSASAASATSATSTPTPPPERFEPKGITVKKMKKDKGAAAAESSSKTSKASGDAPTKLKLSSSSDKPRSTDSSKGDKWPGESSSKSSKSGEVSSKTKPGSSSAGDKVPRSSDKPRSSDPSSSRPPKQPTLGAPSSSSGKPKSTDSSRSKSSDTTVKLKSSDMVRLKSSDSSSKKSSSDRDPSKKLGESSSKPRSTNSSRSKDPYRAGSSDSKHSGGSPKKPRPISPVKFSAQLPPASTTSFNYEPLQPIASSSSAAYPPTAAPAHAPAPVAAATPAAAPAAGYAPPVWPKPPADLPATTSNTMPLRQKRSKVMLQTLTKDPQALYFLRPVDPIRDGCPTYYNEIKKPSDYQSIARNIDQKKYRNMGELARDIELIFANCRQFNPPGPITDMAGANEALYWKEWARAASPKLNAEERKAMVALVNRAFKDNLSIIFREPVDPVKLGIPQYFDIIPPEDARDLTLIKHHLEKGKYSTARQADEDVELMLENARVFNGEGPIMDIANNFGSWWKLQRSKMDV